MGDNIVSVLYKDKAGKTNIALILEIEHTNKFVIVNIFKRCVECDIYDSLMNALSHFGDKEINGDIEYFMHLYGYYPTVDEFMKKYEEKNKK